VPYSIVKRKGPRPWKIIKKDTGKVVGSSVSRAKAKASIKALYLLISFNKYIADKRGGPMSKDVVNHPSHYTSGGIETIDIMASKLSPDEFKGYLKGNVIKYITRAGKKKNELEDLRKCAWYLNRLIEEFK
jgi:hypothetical protein